MSGHSKWSQIKHKKAATDKKRGAVFSKLASAITIAVREGGEDPSTNFRLRLAIDKARAANMPQANIERAIKKGTGELGGSTVKEITFEGFGPQGVAIICEGATDNKNRTISEVKRIFFQNDGRLAGSGSVSYQFEPKGIINIKAPKNKDELELELIDAGAEDFEEADPSRLGSRAEAEDSLIVYTSPSGFGKVKKILVEKNIKILSAELAKEAKNLVLVNDPKEAKKVLDLVEALEAHDDILTVYANFDIPENILNQLEG